MTGTTAMRGEKIYEMDLDLTGVTDFGVSIDAITTGKEAVPLQGARFNLAVNGHTKGRLAGRAHGVLFIALAIHETDGLASFEHDALRADVYRALAECFRANRLYRRGQPRRIR